MRRLEGEAAQNSIAVIKQLSSTGYLRKRLPQELMVLQGGAPAAGVLDFGALSGLALRGGAQTAGVDGDRPAREGEDAGVRGRSVRRMRQLHPGAQRHLHEVQHMRRHHRVQLRVRGAAAEPVEQDQPDRPAGWKRGGHTAPLGAQMYCQTSGTQA